MIAVALGWAVAPSAAAQPTFTFISGYAANAVHAAYHGLASQKAVPAVTASLESRGMVTVPRSTGSRAVSALELGNKTLGPAQISAVLNAMDFAEQHPSALDTVRKDAAAGNYVLETKELGTPYIYVSMSYPGGPELGKTSIVNEMKVSCP